MLNFATLLCNAVSELTVSGDSVSVTFCVPTGYDLDLIVGLNESVRIIHCHQRLWRRDDPCSEFIPDLDLEVDGPATYTLVQSDDSSPDIVLADAWIFLTAFLEHGPILPLKPYLVYAPDFIQRSVPELYGLNPFFQLWGIHAGQCLSLQGSRGVFVTTNQTASDAITYAGVASSKVKVVPMANVPSFDTTIDIDRFAATKIDELRNYLLGSRNTDSSIKKRSGNSASFLLEKSDATGRDNTPYILWVTNASPHKNHVRAIAALERYYNRLGGRLPCKMCGVNTDKFLSWSDHPYFSKVGERLRDSKLLNDKLEILGEKSNDEFRDLLANAAYLWHNVLYDNGTFSVIEAARLGTRSLVSRYPQMVEINDQFSINAEYFDPWNVDDAANSLKRMEDLLITQGPRAEMIDRPMDKALFRENLKSLLEGCAPFGH